MHDYRKPNLVAGPLTLGHHASVRSRRERGPRRAVVLLIVLATLAVAAVVFVTTVKLAAAGRKTLDLQAWQAQAACLAESAVERAAARLAAEDQYQGETWTLSAEELGLPDRAVVRIKVDPLPPAAGSADAPRRLVRVEAAYPDDPHYRAQQNKEVVIEIVKGPKP